MYGNRKLAYGSQEATGKRNMNKRAKEAQKGEDMTLKESKRTAAAPRANASKIRRQI